MRGLNHSRTHSGTHTVEGGPTERKHLSATDVAAAGGWTNSLTLRKVYQQSDAETMLQVVLSGGELREKQG